MRLRARSAPCSVKSASRTVRDGVSASRAGEGRATSAALFAEPEFLEVLHVSPVDASRRIAGKRRDLVAPEVRLRLEGGEAVTGPAERVLDAVGQLVRYDEPDGVIVRDGFRQAAREPHGAGARVIKRVYVGARQDVAAQRDRPDIVLRLESGATATTSSKGHFSNGSFQPACAPASRQQSPARAAAERTAFIEGIAI